MSDKQADQGHYQRTKRLCTVVQIDEIKSVPYTALSHPFVERLIGMTLRERLDQVLFWNAGDLERKLADFRQYYSSHRVHTALAKNTPSDSMGRSVIRPADLGNFRRDSHRRGLYRLPVAA